MTTGTISNDVTIKATVSGDPASAIRATVIAGLLPALVAVHVRVIDAIRY